MTRVGENFHVYGMYQLCMLIGRHCLGGFFMIQNSEGSMQYIKRFVSARTLSHVETGQAVSDIDPSHVHVVVAQLQDSANNHVLPHSLGVLLWLQKVLAQQQSQKVSDGCYKSCLLNTTYLALLLLNNISMSLSAWFLSTHAYSASPIGLHPLQYSLKCSRIKINISRFERILLKNKSSAEHIPRALYVDMVTLQCRHVCMLQLVYGLASYPGSN